MTLKGKRAVVTGSNSGIGLGVAVELAKAGAEVVINSFTDRDEDHALAARIAADHGVTARYADAVIHNDVIHLVEVPSTSTADITVQTREVLASIERQLTKLGSAPARILMATIYLTDLADCEAMNALWDAWIPPGSAPARACVKVAGLVDPGWRIEIALSAAR